VGGTIPLFGWRLKGGWLTGFLWALFVTGLLSGLARLVWRLLLAAIGRVIPLTVRTPAEGNRPAASSGEGDVGDLPRPPEGAQAGYHAGFAAHCAVASQLAYKTNEAVLEAARALNLGGCSIIVEHNHRCLFLVFADFIIVAFRGTDPTEIADWKTNVRHTPAPGPFGPVHEGYLAAVELLWPRITASLQRMREHEQPLLLTGHSMGGALAVVAAAKFAAENAIPVAGLYTFGQPAVAEPAFETELATRLDGRYFRFVNSVDMVPGLLDGTSLKGGGQLLFIDRVGRIHTGDATSRIESARVLSQVLEPETDRAPLQDHDMAEYVRALSSAAPAGQRHSGIRGLTPRESLHLWVSAALYVAVFLTLCVLTWRTHGAEAFALGTGALFTLAILGVMFVLPQEYNDHLLHWYTRQGLTPK
jgi:triacylglycerol lipase